MRVPPRDNALGHDALLHDSSVSAALHATPLKTQRSIVLCARRLTYMEIITSTSYAPGRSPSPPLLSTLSRSPSPSVRRMVGSNEVFDEKPTAALCSSLGLESLDHARARVPKPGSPRSNCGRHRVLPFVVMTMKISGLERTAVSSCISIPPRFGRCIMLKSRPSKCVTLFDLLHLL